MAAAVRGSGAARVRAPAQESATSRLAAGQSPRKAAAKPSAKAAPRAGRGVSSWRPPSPPACRRAWPWRESLVLALVAVAVLATGGRGAGRSWTAPGAAVDTRFAGLGLQRRRD